MPISEIHYHFRLLQKFKPDYSPSEFTQYESRRTGMSVMVVNQNGPKVFGYFVLATKLHDDSGVAHALEHLCFMGSRSFRYKGLLDKIATRAYSSTNAWTAIDHTMYTLNSAGWEGFCRVLPVYLDHIIAPTLTDASYCTEVYHIDGSGHDAGVVYSEMQGVQNISSELMGLRLRQLLYPEGAGLQYEIGGRTEMLRVLTAQHIRDFHREMYKPGNLCLIIIGEVDHENMLETLDKFESTILDIIPKFDSPCRRPWMESCPTPPLKTSIVETVEFPEEDESLGKIEIGFLGPDCLDPVQTCALNIVLVYLAGSSAAALVDALVEKEQTASGVYSASTNHPNIEIRFTLTGVALEKLPLVEKQFFEVLRNTIEKSLDMKYLCECIQRQKRSRKFSIENSAVPLVEYIISDFLFGKRDSSTLLTAVNLREYDVIEKWGESQWRSFIKKWIANAPHVSILGVPSSNLAKKLKLDEETRIAAQKNRFGEGGLKRLAENLEKAKAEHDKEIPYEILAKFKVPGIESIRFADTITARSGSALGVGRPNNNFQRIVDADAIDAPLFIHFEHIPSDFVRLSLLISAEPVPSQLRPLLSVYTKTFFNLPVLHDGKTIDFKQVITELERDTIRYSMESARDLGNSEMLRISFQIEVDKYQKVISWLKELIWNSIFDVNRLKAITTRLLADTTDTKRSGDDMVAGVCFIIHYAAESIIRSRSALVKVSYLRQINRLLTMQPETVVLRMEEIRRTLFRFENFRILVVGDLERLQNPVSSWQPFLATLKTNGPLLPITNQRALLSKAGKSPGKLSYIVPMGTINSSFAHATARGPDAYDHPMLPALLVSIAYMNAIEGPLWVAVRGAGLAHGTYFAYDIDIGYVKLNVYRSSNAYKAFKACKQIVENYVSGTALFDPLMVEGAINSIIVKFANEQATIASAAKGSFIRQVIRELPSDHREKTLVKIKEITVDEIKETLRVIIMPLFDPNTSNLVVTCAPVLEKTIKVGLESFGFEPDVKGLKYFEEDYELKVDRDDEI